MQKKTAVILSTGLVAAILFLLYKNKNKVAELITPSKPVNYLNYNYPDGATPNINFSSNKSCGCNPDASKFLSGASSSLNKAQTDFDEKLKKYIESMNTVFETNTFS